MLKYNNINSYKAYWATRPLGAGLYSIGIPKESVLKYETAIKAGKYVIVAHGTAGEVANAKKIIEGTKAIESVVHHTEPVKV
jgi:hydrogenase maturation factor